MRARPAEYPETVSGKSSRPRTGGAGGDPAGAFGAEKIKGPITVPPITFGAGHPGVQNVTGDFETPLGEDVGADGVRLVRLNVSYSARRQTNRC